MLIARGGAGMLALVAGLHAKMACTAAPPGWTRATFARASGALLFPPRRSSSSCTRCTCSAARWRPMRRSSGKAPQQRLCLAGS